MTEILNDRFLLRGGLAAALAGLNEVPLRREMIIELDNLFTTGAFKAKIGDGTTHYNDLPYLQAGGGVETLVAGYGISINNTDPKNPSIASSLGSISVDGQVADYASLPTPPPSGMTTYYVISDGLIYIWNGSSYPASGNGIYLSQFKGVDITNNILISGNKVFPSKMSALKVTIAGIDYAIPAVRIGAVFTPALLFAGGINGAWYDPSDLSTMFQDVAGTIPATAAGQTIALMNDKSGNGYHVSQTTASARPSLQRDTNNNWYLKFSGAQFLQLAKPNNLYPGTNGVLIVAGASFDTASSDQAVISRSVAGNFNGRYGLLRDSGASPAGLESLYYGNSVQNSVSIGDTTTGLRVLTQDTNRISGYNALRVNVTEMARENFTPDYAVNLNQQYRLIIGSYANNTDSGQIAFFTGRMYGAIIRLAASQDDSLRDAAENWMLTKISP